MKPLLLALGLCLAILGCARTAAIQEGGESLDLSRAAFIRELLDPRQTDVTANFDDYTPGSYHVNKLDLVLGIDSLRRVGRQDVIGVFVHGPAPMDPLWSYRAWLFLQEGDSVRVNALIMPHARITAKTTGVVSREAFDALTDSMRGNRVMRPANLTPDTTASPYATEFLLATFSGSETWAVEMPGTSDREEGDAPEVQAAYEALNSLLPDPTVTYSLGR